MLTELCNCGKPARYSHIINEKEVLSCNKRIVCKSYDGLLAELSYLHSNYNALLQHCETFYKNTNKEDLNTNYPTFLKHLWNEGKAESERNEEITLAINNAWEGK